MRRQGWVIYAGVSIAIYAAGVPLFLISILYYNRAGIDRIQQALRQNDQDTSGSSFINAEELARQFSEKRRRSSIVTSVREDLFWMIDKFEKYREGCWYTGDLLLVLRLLQTSLLVLVPTQSLQAAAACGIAISGACALREAQPYRRDSDNETAVIAQYIICMWCFSVVLRYLGVSDPKVLVAMGVTLILATVGAFVHAVWRARDEDKASLSQPPEADEQSEAQPTPSVDATEANDELPTEPAANGGQSPRDVETELTAQENDRHAPIQKPPLGGASPIPSWHILGLCTAEPEVADGGDEAVCL